MVRGMHLVLLVLAALVCVEYTHVYMCCGAWSAPGAVSACCTCHMCLLYVCVVVLGAHLVQSVLPALVICVGCMCCGAWSILGAVSACCTYICVGYM